MAPTTIKLQDFGLDEALFDIFDVTEEFAPSGRSVTLRKGVKTPFLGTINGKEYEAYAQLHSAEFSRLSIMSHTVVSDNDRETSIASGVHRPTSMEISLLMDGKEISLVQLLTDIVNSRRVSRGQDAHTVESFGRVLARMGLYLVNDLEYGLKSEMPLLWQHFGAEESTVEEAYAILAGYGAIDAMPPPEKAGRIVRAMQVERGKSGAPVLELEIGRVDRSKTRTAGATYKDASQETQVFDGTGFIDFCDALFGSFQRGLSQRIERSVLKNKIKELASSGAGSEEDIRALRDQVGIVDRKITSWMTNWGGAQQRVTANPDGTLTFDDIYDPVSVPSGRVVVEDANGEVRELSFWKNQDGTASTLTSNATVDTTGGAADDDDELDNEF